MSDKKTKISYAIKVLTAVCSLVGVTLSLILYAEDGYSHWAKRLMYFTTMSNVWVGLLFLFMIILPFTKLKNNEKVKRVTLLVKYSFTIAITITGFIFLCVLAPFAHKSGYNAWSISSILTHMLTPALTIPDFFLGEMIALNKKHLFLSLIPLFFYLIFASILCVLKVDFGRGEPFPYFFFNYYSPAGLFGFSPTTPPFVLGSVYWIILILLITLSIGLAYIKLHPKNKKK